MKYLIGVDVGGTTSTIALGDSERRLRYVSNQFHTPAAEGPHATIHALVTQIEDALQRFGLTTHDLAKVSIATQDLQPWMV